MWIDQIVVSENPDATQKIKPIYSQKKNILWCPMSREIIGTYCFENEASNVVTLLDLFLWGYWMENVNVNKTTTIPELKRISYVQLLKQKSPGRHLVYSFSLCFVFYQKKNSIFYKEGKKTRTRYMLISHVFNEYPLYTRRTYRQTSFRNTWYSCVQILFYLFINLFIPPNGTTLDARTLVPNQRRKYTYWDILRQSSFHYFFYFICNKIKNQSHLTKKATDKCQPNLLPLRTDAISQIIYDLPKKKKKSSRPQIPQGFLGTNKHLLVV